MKQKRVNDGQRVTYWLQLVDADASSGNVIVGYQSRGQSYAVSIGFQSNSESDGVAIGGISSAQHNGVAIGRWANAGTGLTHTIQLTDDDGDPVYEEGLPVYKTYTDYTSDDTAVGNSAKAYGGYSSAFGSGSQATGSYSTALGDSARALKYGSTAVGNSAQASEWNSTAMGNNALAGGWGSTAIGYEAQATGSGSIAIGFGMHGPANSSGEDALALGSGAAASMDNSVALGAGSTTIYDFSAAQKTTMTLDGQTYKFAGTPFEDNGIVSVGSSGKERVLTNVAPGRISADSTDAINGSQLYGTNQALEALSKRTVKYDVKDGNVDTSNITLAGNGGTTITNVADTSITGDSTNAVNSRTVFNETRVSKDGTYIRKDNSAARNIEALDHQVALNGDSIVSLQSDIHSLGHRVNKVGAGAAALAGLHPLDFDPDDKWDFAASTGSYRNAHAFAVGAFYRPNEGTMFSLGGSFGNGENMWNAGVSLKLGRGSGDTSYSKTVMAREIVFLQDKVKAQDEKISSYETRLAAQDKELAELKDTVNRLSAALGVK
ncbi:YadA-like family protein [Dialister sp.]|uniref:YadA-like family protein n=1 Tax=Dialister sp. TaxID=1955814 RepID=UPI003A5C17FC